MTVMASGGGGGSSSGVSGGVPVNIPAPAYVKYAEVAENESALGGSSLRNPANVAGGTPDVVTLSGTITHSSGAIELDDGTYQFVDIDGPDANTLAYSDASNATITKFALLDTSAYDYLIAGRQSYTDTNQSYENVLISGIATNSADMPKSGQATYVGTATASVFDANGSYVLTNGTSNIVAIFAGNGSVNATLNRFADTSGVVPIDTIKLLNMTIAGNSYSGGTLATELKGQTVDATGGGTSAAKGTFFGYTASGKPAETGGVFIKTGDAGQISGAFLGK
ncbi:hypothetical protein [Pseudogemmobacter sp. W21_MBD1_M6]|uniref:hypothetical protein n=1 Tax=Pseudogemmobacter sp. W21_MBD1_M6 TaxID=3240271 RepID=UPI003F959AD3